MANIPGTIFQMKDGPSASAGNLFPKTVVGAVLGLDATIQAIKNYYTTQLGNYWLNTDVTYNQNTHILQVGPGNTVNLATVTDLSNYYTKTEADGRFLGINTNAASATKLQTARAIWGQSFDGTANVTGAMSGVTSIDSLINIDNGYVGIGKTPSVALDVNGQVSGTQLVSTVGNSAPLVVGSTSLVTYLNADLLDGSHLSDILAMDITGNAKTATNPKSELKTGQEFVFRKTNVDWDAKSGVVKKIKGKTIAWNQLFNPSTIVDSGVMSKTSTGFSLSGSVSSSAFPTLNTIPVIAGHKYAVICHYTGTEAGGESWLLFENSNTCGSIVTYADNPQIVTCTTSGTFNLAVAAYANGISLSVDAHVKFVDLTLLFNGSVPSNYTVADFERDYPELYYPYCEGDLSSNDAEAIETTGANQWDEEWESGDWDVNGQPHADASRIRGKNPIPLFPSTQYYVKCTQNISIRFFDAEGNYIDTGTYNSENFTTPAGAAYGLMYVYSTATYNHDICINLSNASFNGQYEPYWKKDLHLGLKEFKVKSPNIWDEEWESGIINFNTGIDQPDAGMCRSVGYISVNPGDTYYLYAGGISQTSNLIVIVYDSNKGFIKHYSGGSANSSFTIPSNGYYIRFTWVATSYSNDITINKSDPAFNGRYFPSGTLTLEGGLKGNGDWSDYIENGKYHKRCGRYNLGDAGWNKWIDYHGFASTTSIPYAKPGVFGTLCNIISSKYNAGVPGGISSEQEGCAYWDGLTTALCITDSSKDSVSANDFKTAMNGVYLDYELQYEEVYELAESLPSVFPCDMDGTERVISPVSTTPSTPFLADIQYGAKSDDIATDLISVRASVQPLLDALEFDGPNNAWHLKGNLYADGFTTAYGINGGARTAVIAPYVIESSNYSTSKIWVRLNVMNEAIAKYKQGYLVQAKKAGEYITYSVTSIDESSYILYCNGGSVTVELES